MKKKPPDKIKHEHKIIILNKNILIKKDNEKIKNINCALYWYLKYLNQNTGTEIVI